MRVWHMSCVTYAVLSSQLCCCAPHDTKRTTFYKALVYLPKAERAQGLAQLTHSLLKAMDFRSLLAQKQCSQTAFRQAVLTSCRPRWGCLPGVGWVALTVCVAHVPTPTLASP